MKNTNLLISNGVDIQKSLELFGDMETYDATLDDFLSAVDHKLSDMKKYKEIGDMANYAILVHSLKSDSKYLGFTKLAELSYDHEMQSKANNMYYVTEHYDELMAEANRIVALVKQYTGVSQEAPVEVQKEENIILNEKTILVVDDSNIIRNFIQKVFDNNYRVVVANDGREALNIIENNMNNKIVGMLLDLNMPNVNGFEVLEYFKQNNLFNKIPVSIITGEDSREMIDKAFSYGIVDVLTKPFNERDVKRIVEKTIDYTSNI